MIKSVVIKLWADISEILFIWNDVFINNQMCISFPYYRDYITPTLKSRVISSDLTRLNEIIQLLCPDQT